MYYLIMVSQKSFIIKSKITIPDSAAELVDRERLFKRMDSCLNRKIVSITGTAGSGKTALMQSWIINRGIKTAWYSLDEFDNDLVSFYEYLCAAIREGFGDFFSIFKHFIEAVKNSQQPVNSMELTSAFISGIESASEEFILVIDDFHTVSNLDIISSVRFLFNHMPDNLQIIILTRNDLPFPVSKLRQSGRLEEISADDLVFNKKEISKCLQLYSGKKPEPDIVKKISFATAGWGIAVGLAGASISSGGMDFIEKIPKFSSQLSGFLLEEVLEHLDEGFLFLLKIAAVPDGFSVELVDFLILKLRSSKINLPGSGLAFIDQMNKRIPFLSCFEGRSDYYKLHDFFRDFLLHQLEKEDRCNKTDIEDAVCDWYRSRNIPEEALEYAFRSKSSERISPLLEEVVKKHADDRQLFRYERWLEDSDAFLNNPLPELEIHRARMHLYKGEIPEVYKRLALADLGIKKRAPGTESDRLKASCLLMKSVISMYSGDQDKTAELCENASDLISGPEDRLFCICRTYLSLSSLYSGKTDIKKTITMLDEAAESGRLSGDWILAYSADFQKSLFTAAAGNTRLSLEQHENRIKEIESRNLPFFGILGNSYSEKARIQLEMEKHNLCIDFADRGLELAEDSCSISSIWWSLFIRTMLSCSSETRTAAEEYFKKLFIFEKENMILPSFRTLSEALYLEFLTDTDVHEAEKLFYVQFSQEQRPQSYLQLPLFTACSRYLIKTNRKSEAAPVLEKIRSLSGSFGNTEILLKAMLLLGKQAEAEDLALKSGFMHTFHTYLSPVEKKECNIREIIQDDDYAFREPLSERETEVIKLLSSGKSNIQIAEKLFISMNTVKTHLKNINGKLGTTNRTQAVHIARSSGLC